jgi:hypothetical protein
VNTTIPSPVAPFSLIDVAFNVCPREIVANKTRANNMPAKRGIYVMICRMLILVNIEEYFEEHIEEHAKGHMFNFQIFLLFLDI